MKELKYSIHEPELSYYNISILTLILFSLFFIIGYFFKREDIALLFLIAWMILLLISLINSSEKVSYRKLSVSLLKGIILAFLIMIIIQMILIFIFRLTEIWV